MKINLLGFVITVERWRKPAPTLPTYRDALLRRLRNLPRQAFTGEIRFTRIIPAGDLQYRLTEFEAGILVGDGPRLLPCEVNIIHTDFGDVHLQFPPVAYADESL